ncbi:RDM16-like protein isoform X2 [Tanacetum coccineum]
MHAAISKMCRHADENKRKIALSMVKAKNVQFLIRVVIYDYEVKYKSGSYMYVHYKIKLDKHNGQTFIVSSSSTPSENDNSMRIDLDDGFSKYLETQYGEGDDYTELDIYLKDGAEKREDNSFDVLAFSTGGGVIDKYRSSITPKTAEALICAQDCKVPSRLLGTPFLQSQFGEAQAIEFKAKQAQLAKAKAEPNINPNLIEETGHVDVPLLDSGTYKNITEGGLAEEILKKEKINLYVEHPRPIEPPAEPAPPPPQPLKLTQKECKKLHTQRRLATEKNRQEMIRLEMEIRSAAAQREQAHVDKNITRKLTPAERREKKEMKLFDDNNTLEIIVSVYKMNDLSHPQTRFKVDVNAQENRYSIPLRIEQVMNQSVRLMGIYYKATHKENYPSVLKEIHAAKLGYGNVLKLKYAEFELPEWK